MKKNIFIISFALSTGAFWTVSGRTDGLPQLARVDSVAIDGITWKFDQSAPIGRFINGLSAVLMLGKSIGDHRNLKNGIYFVKNEPRTA
jgi:hypothetical protein